MNSELNITKPTLLLDVKKCKANIEMMANKAKASHVIFRPHFKTHQSREIGQWFKEQGVSKITVSSLSMALYFSNDWNDITVAFPVNIREIETINELAGKIQLNLCVENIEAAEFLTKNLKHRVHVFLKMDVGYHRTGIDPANTELIERLLGIFDNSEKLTFLGFLGHAGHTYKCRTKDDILTIEQESIAIMQDLKSSYSTRYSNLIVSLGDTPGCSVADAFEGMDEVRPGNFVFYDLTQQQIGSNTIDQIAIALACPIVAIHHKRNEIVVYGGGVHFAKDQLHTDKHGTIYGLAAKKTGNNWSGLINGMYVKSLSQEHGTIAVPKAIINQYNIGNYLIVLPVHSCMTANLMKQYYTTEGKTIKRL